MLEDSALGNYKSSKIYRDDVPEEIDAIPSTSMHRHVDIAVVQAARDFGNKAKVVIVMPPLIYGFNPAHQRHSFGLVSLVRFAVKHGFAGYVGEGHNTWSVVHVKDVAHAYMILLTHIENSKPEVLLQNPYYFAENGFEMSLGEAAEHIGRILYDIGKIQTPQTQTFSESHFQDVLVR